MNHSPIFLLLLLSPFIFDASAWSPFMPQTTRIQNVNIVSAMKAPIRLPFHKSITKLKKSIPLHMSAKSDDAISSTLSFVDKNVLYRTVRIANHIPALLSLSYFGLISMASMMGPMDSLTEATATLVSVLTRSVGPTTNSAFSQLFPTLITPANFVFLVWPIISIFQLLTVATSAFMDATKGEPLLSQNDLSSLTLANLAATAWLLISSNASATYLPIGSFLILPLVPLFSGLSLRTGRTRGMTVNRIYSSFTTVASFLALAVELQHGGRLPWFPDGKAPAELAACVFVACFGGVLNSVQREGASLSKYLVHSVALTGILAKRVIGSSVLSLGLSISFWGTACCWAWSLKQLFFGPKKN